MANHNPMYGGWPQATPAWSPNMQYPQPSTYSGANSQVYGSQQPVDNVYMVAGPESAKSFRMPPNSRAVLFDANDPIFYFVITDDAGYATMRTFTFSEQTQGEIVAQVVPEDLSEYAKKSEIEAMQSEISDIRNMVKELM